MPSTRRFYSFFFVGILAAALIGAMAGAPLWASTLSHSPFKTAPRLTKIDQKGWVYQFADEKLEDRWSWRAEIVAGKTGEIRVVFGWKDAKNFALLSLTPQINQKPGQKPGQMSAALRQVRDGQTLDNLSSGVTFGPRGTLTLQKVGARVRALCDGSIVAEATLSGTLSAPGTQFGWASHGGFQIDAGDIQPTENVVFRDDFMRAEGPDDAEIPGAWKVTGLWKTSGALGPKSDAALNPNPFVFRAQGEKMSTARAGKWWWSDYSVSVSIRATRQDEKSPLVAGIEAFSSENASGEMGSGEMGSGVRGEIDFVRGVARLKNGDKVLAQSPVFDAEAGQWHRVRLEPGPGVAKLFVDGVLRVSAPANWAQGGVAMRAITGADNFVDFDDVRVGALNGSHEWGEGALPERFQKDRLMSHWASQAGNWKRDEMGTWWNSGDFFGAVDLEMPLPKLEAGEGWQFLFACDPKKPRSGVRGEISRGEGASQLTLGLRGAKREKLLGFPLNLPNTPLHITFSVTNGQPSLRGTLGTQKFDFPAIGLDTPFLRGLKVGIRPLKNGKPLPPPQLQKVSIVMDTFEREGRTVVGVNITPVSTEIARQLGLPDAAGAIVDNVEANSPAKRGGVLEGDVIRGVDNQTVTDVDSMRASVGAVKPGASLTLHILRPPVGLEGLDWEQCSVSTPQMLDYSFTAAPVDWHAARGTWDVAERWTCSPQWSFFAGQNDLAPLLWSRFAAQGDWTLEAYLATPMDLSRGERSPSDLNVTVGADGKDLASGYSFVFAGKNRGVNQIWRGNHVVFEKPFELPPGAGEAHQDWFYVRLERRGSAQGVRFIYSVNGREIDSYLDKSPLPDGGHFGFWTQNGGLSIARVRLWHAALKPSRVGNFPPVLAPSASEMHNALGFWTPRGQNADASARLSVISQSLPASGESAANKPLAGKNQPLLQVSNPQGGGDWTVYVTRKPFNAKLNPVLEWDYRVPENAKINLFALIDNSWREIVFTGGGTASPDDMAALGTIPGVLADGNWHHARFDLLGALLSKGIADLNVDALSFAAPMRDYLPAGLGGNPPGATYWLRDFKVSPQ